MLNQEGSFPQLALLAVICPGKTELVSEPSEFDNFLLPKTKQATGCESRKAWLIPACKSPSKNILILPKMKPEKLRVKYVRISICTAQFRRDPSTENLEPEASATSVHFCCASV